MKNFTQAAFVLIVLFCFTGIGKTQSTDAREKPQADSLSSTPSGEIIFDEIVIEGVIEKPNIAILPTRERTEFGEIDFVNRSFSSELKALPPRSSLIEPVFSKPTRLKKNYARLIKLKKR